MISIDRILCPANSGFQSDEALRYAASLARVYRAELLICHCRPAPSLVGALTLGDDGIRMMLNQIVKRYIGLEGNSQPRCEVIVEDSGRDVGAEIVRLAHERAVDVIVMRSRHAPLSSLLGSVAEQVSRNASCSVLIVRPRDQSRVEPKGQHTFRRVLVCHDFSTSAQLALSYGLSIAQKYRAQLHLIHVLPAPVTDTPEILFTAVGGDTAYHRAVRRLEEAVPEEVYRTCRVKHVVEWGKPYREILAYARKAGIDMVCMGALGRDYGSGALFGSNVDRVLRQVACPVFIARPLTTAIHKFFERPIARTVSYRRPVSTSA